MPTAPGFVRTAAAAVIALAVGLIAVPTQAQPAVAEAATVFTIADGAIALDAPAGWQRVQPKSGIVETEFAIPSEGAAADGAALAPGRMTVMGAGGSVEANIERWYGQFAQPDGSSTKDKSAVKKLKVAGRDVTLVANDYHKNRSMHDTWLADLGCRFAESPANALHQGWRAA
jgi:hypothetical protein